MKKYIIPAVRVADINNNTLLTGSIDYDPSNSFGDEGKVGARRRGRGRQNYDDIDIYYEEEDEDF